MFEEYQICPYTGLRSFTEEESLYFKGREEHIEQATLQLQRNKFLMLTGASGDGKSSLVYAGIVPNARAGFLKAKYTQWRVADFRPERSPFKNLCKTLTRQLDIANSGIVESELQHGFSALTDLYKNSDCFADMDSMVWHQSNDIQKAALKRKAANLLIIVDQFEEFFTNPENYHQGVPSRDSNLVLNLLLETARIALEENLPIYIVFTMRSDYIGQCAAFRSLPEYLGFSQFFVPRLNRVQLQQVIEEPATLSGNRISRRLTERLIHDIAEGVDQLPILQHALNQIWHAANKGTEEMDLIHYAMVSGMSATELPDEQLDRFNTWFYQLPEEIKKCYHRPDLQNVLDTHANKLYESAEEEFLKKTGKYISDLESKQIIKMAFSCLTKIDQSRAVRNRMTLQEIHQILNNKSVDVETINQVLNVFREPGNTFIRPFITEDPESTNLGAENILDITHESLIRNWDLLKTWAKEEYDSYLISQDFEQQLGRWVESGKSNNYLLSIGPLTYFENWYNKVKPNTWWIARYLPEEEQQGDKITRAEIIQNNSQEFLKRSAQKHIITRTVMKVGPKRIAAVLAALIIIVLSSFGISNYVKRQNSSVLRAVKKETIVLANDNKLDRGFTIPLITQQIEQGNLTIREVLGSVKDSLQRIRIASWTGELLVAQGWYQPVEEINQCLFIADSLLARAVLPETNMLLLTKYLKEHNDFRVTLGYAYFLNPTDALKSMAIRNGLRSGNLVKQILKASPASFTDVANFTLALENALNYKTFTTEDLRYLLTQLSPFESSKRSDWVNKIFNKEKILIRGSQSYGFKFNGLYQQLAYLYAAIGNSEKALRCIDTLLYYNQIYYQNDYESMVDNATNIVGVFHTYDQKAALEAFITGYCNLKKVSPQEFYNRTISRILIDYSTDGNSNLNLKFCSADLIAFLGDKFRKAITALPQMDERNYALAQAYKNEGMLISYRSVLQGLRPGNPVIDSFFLQSYHLYRSVDKKYLSKIIPVVNSSASDLINIPIRQAYLYPDYFLPFHPGEPRNYLFNYNSPAFIEFILKNSLMDTLYHEKEDFKVFERWILNYHAVSSAREVTLREAMPHTTMGQLAVQLEKMNANNNIDLNLINLYLGNISFQNKAYEEGILYFLKIQPEKVLNAFQFKGVDAISFYSLEQYSIAIAHLYAMNQIVKAQELIHVFNKRVNRSSIYSFAAQYLLLHNEHKEIARSLIDSSKAEMKRIENPALFQPNRHQIAYALMLMDARQYEPEAQKTIKNSINKFAALTRFSLAHALNGDLHKSYLEIPPNISSGDRATFLYQLLLGYTKTSVQKESWKKFEENIQFGRRFFLPYINENE